jgi:hypothetical protein
VQIPATVACSANIALFAEGSIITLDVQGTGTPPCQIEGAYQMVNEAVYAIVGFDVFKRHTIDLSKELPPEFHGAIVNISSISADMPPSIPVLHAVGESIMSKAQFEEFTARLEEAASSANQ